MIAVMFEVELKPDEVDTYFELAHLLKASLIKMPGFISIERFQSLSEPQASLSQASEAQPPKPAKVLSLSFWQDEAAVANWRKHTEHNQAQGLGREKVFDDYRIRVAHVVRDYGLHRRDEAPK